MTIKKFFLTTFFFCIITDAFSQNFKLPMIEAQNHVDSLCWNDNSTLFAYSDGNTIKIRKADDFTVYQTLETDAETITNLKFIEMDSFTDSDENSTCILYTTAENNIQIVRLSTDENESILQLSGDSSFVQTAFSCNDDLSFLAFGYDDGSLEYFINKEKSSEYENEDLETDNPFFTDCGNGYKKTSIKISENSIKNIVYNGLEHEYITIDSQNTILLWNETFEEKSGNESKLVEDLYTLLNGEKNQHTNVFLSSDFQELFILSSSNSIAAYDVPTEQTIGYIPSFTESPMLHFTVNKDCNYFITAHEDNSIYIFQTEKFLLPVYSPYMVPQIFNMDEPGALEQLLSTDPPKEEALTMLRYKDVNTINLRLKTEIIPSPYIIGINFAAGYTENKLIQPFYFAGYLEPYLGFPQKDFPYKYEMNGSPLSSPLIFGLKLYAPFGICVYPFQRNIEVFVDVAPGIVFNNIWNSKLGKNRITSRCYPAFCAALHAGATYQNVSVFVEGNYDAILGFGFSIGVGYNFNFNFMFFVKDDKNEE